MNVTKFSRGTLARAWTWQLITPTNLSSFSSHTRSFSTKSPLAQTNSHPRQNASKFQSPSSDAAPAPALLLPEFDLSSHVILVSGAARGLGLTMSSALLEAGATVYALDRLPSPTPPFDTLQSRFSSSSTPSSSSSSSSSSRLHYRQIDVRNVPQLNRIVEEIGDKEGRMDGLIAAAGIQQETSALEYTKEDANRMFEVNVTGVLMTSQAVAKQMIRYGNGGSVALIASMSGTVANRGLICPAYNASKAAVVQLGRNLASEWGPEYGIRVNTISPGYIRTAMVEELFVRYPERKEQWPRENMLGRISLPEEFRAAAVFLMGKGSSFMTGADLRIDGGHCAW